MAQKHAFRYLFSLSFLVLVFGASASFAWTQDEEYSPSDEVTSSDTLIMMI